MGTSLPYLRTNFFITEGKIETNNKAQNSVGSIYNAGQKELRKTRKTASYLKPQAIENSFKREYGEVEDNIIISIERLKT